MADGARYGEGGDPKYSTPHGEQSPKGGPPVAGSSPESSIPSTPAERDYLNTGVMPQPRAGVIFARCAWCSVQMTPVECAQDDPSHARRTDRCCAPCLRAQLATLGPVCDECPVLLEAYGTCPACGVSHAGDPCQTCGRRGLHRDDCTDPGDPWMEAGPRAPDAHAIAHSIGERFVSEDCTAYLRGLGLEIEPGGVA